ncbi:MAG: hypothetical protein NVSMB45_12090 [Ginsengibacter sp.]
MWLPGKLAVLELENSWVSSLSTILCREKNYNNLKVSVTCILIWHSKYADVGFINVAVLL